MSDSKAHEETWQAGVFVERAEGASRSTRAIKTPHGDLTFVTPVEDDTAALDALTLAAAAPELARVLLANEWGGIYYNDDPETGGRCPSCFGYEPSGSPDDGHHVDCALEAVLRKAGLR